MKFFYSKFDSHTQNRRNIREENSVAYFIINVPEFSKILAP